MTLMLDLTPEMETKLQQRASEWGQDPSQFVLSALEVLLAEESEDTVFKDMRALSSKTLLEYWDNDEDAIYDTL